MHGIDRPLGRLLDRQVRESVLLRADWPAPVRVRAFTTLRRGLEVGESLPPFDAFNLGARCGAACLTGRGGLSCTRCHNDVGHLE